MAAIEAKEVAEQWEWRPQPKTRRRGALGRHDWKSDLPVPGSGSRTPATTEMRALRRRGTLKSLSGMEQSGSDEAPPSGPLTNIPAPRVGRLSTEYLSLRKGIWQPLAERLGEKWHVVGAQIRSPSLAHPSVTLFRLLP